MPCFRASIVIFLMLAALWIQESHQRPYDPCPAWICNPGGLYGGEGAGGIEPGAGSSIGVVENSGIEIIYVARGSNNPCPPGYQPGPDNKLNCNSGGIWGGEGIGDIELGVGESGPPLTKVDVWNKRVPPTSANKPGANKEQKGSNKDKDGSSKVKENGAKPGGGFVGTDTVYIVSGPEIPCPPDYQGDPNNKCREEE